MDEDLGQLEKYDIEDVARVSSSMFFEIAAAWRLTGEQQETLLATDDLTEPTRQTLDRISHICGIYRALHTLFENKQQANEWVHRANSDLGGATGLDVMLSGDIVGIRRYLEAQLV
ncbi:MAG: MbcA/ParS/Xre antitoxin family protein [Motiliproteus sp.]|nr:MbcA/ParS/Xre antitoxin family protein [Motiliproteus sp.]MCW9052339.1 MbcA/ParS/Xre antitoxin family protein [Motiliproteus sp.]